MNANLRPVHTITVKIALIITRTENIVYYNLTLISSSLKLGLTVNVFILIRMGKML